MLLSMFVLVSSAQPGWSYQLSPEDGNCSVSSEGQIFTITFTGKEKVFPVKGGKISLNADDGTQMYPIQFLWGGTSLPAEPWVFPSSIEPYGTVTFSGNQVIIDFKTGLNELEDYYITVHPQSIRDASLTEFNGLLGDASPGSNFTGPLTCGDDLGYGWDFTVEDVTLPELAGLDPEDEEPNVSTTAPLKIEFNVDMDWSAAYANGVADLQPGDIAIYTSTDPNFGQFGGDIIYHTPDDVTISGDEISIQFDELPALTNVYVRIKEGIFKKYQECPQCNDEFLWEGFNGNGQDELLNNNGEWNFKTKDATAPTVTILATNNCGSNVEQDTEFTITLNEGVIYKNNMVPFEALEVDEDVTDYVVYTGGGFEAVVTSINGNVVITVTPDDLLVSGETYTVGLAAGTTEAGKADLWDASLNMVSATTKDFTAGDFLAPVVNFTVTTEEGTTFQILANSDESATVYYVVVEKDDAWVNGDYYPPTLQQIVDLGSLYDGDTNPNANIPVPGDPYADTDPANALDLYTFEVDDDDDVDVNIWAAGIFNTPQAGTDYLERVWDLPRSNSTEYVVFAIAIDKSVCGPYNHELVVDGDEGDELLEGWVTDLLLFDATTKDVLPPLAEFDAERTDQEDQEDTCTDEIDGEYTDPIKRDGPVYITFNEGIELVNGDINNGADIAAAFLLDDGSAVDISDASSYDAATFTVTLIPERSFVSGSNLEVTIPVNSIKDLAGNENYLADNYWFCVENYCEPYISWTADKIIDRQLVESMDLTKPNEPGYPDDNIYVAKDGKVRIVFDMHIYNETGDKLTNTNDAATGVKNFVKIRESAVDAYAAETGLLIYDGDLVDFSVTVDYFGTNDSTVITIEPNGFVYRSEYWYNVEVEGYLQSYSGLTILDGPCYGEGYNGGAQTNHVSFQIIDHTAPVVTFFEDTDLDYTNDWVRYLNECDGCDDPSVDFALDNYIGVEITEWIELGFDGFPRELVYTETIADANALRRYFRIELCDSDDTLKFDVVNFTLVDDGDKGTAYMYLNPYFDSETTVDEEDNFETGVNYTVKFLSNLYEVDYGPGAFSDEFGNLAEEAEACFTGFVDPADPLVCEPVIFVGPEVCDGVTTDDEELMVSFTFERAMTFTDDDPTVTVSSTTDPANYSSLIIDGTYGDTDGKVWMFNGFVLDLVPGDEYEVIVTPGAFKSSAGSPECTWPVEEDVVATFVVGDDVAPEITTVLDPYIEETITKVSGDIVLTFTEPVVPVSGQYMQVFEAGTNTQVASVNIGHPDIDFDDEVVTIPNKLFAGNLKYETNYYVQFNAGLVKDECENLMEDDYLEKTLGSGEGFFWFTTGEDLPPEFVCDKFSPLGEVIDYAPDFVITFNEPVEPVDGAFIDIYFTPFATVASFGQFAVEDMVPNANKTVYTIPFSEITRLSGNVITFGNCYHLNIPAGAFVDVSGGLPSPQVISFDTENTTIAESDCSWTFCIDDTVCPEVTFWPEEGYENIPLNAHLFVQFDEPVQLGETGFEIPLTTLNAQSYFNLQKDVDGTLEDVPFYLETVSADKTWIMIVPEDPEAPELITTSNVHMVGDTEYILTVMPNGDGPFGDGSLGIMQDANGNYVGCMEGEGWYADNVSVTFRTEDVLCPLEELEAQDMDLDDIVTISDITAEGFKLTVGEWPEHYGYGKVNYRVVRKGNANTAANALKSGTLTFSATKTTVAVNVTGIDANYATGYDYDVFLEFIDDEVDAFDEDAEILAEWPYKEIEGLELIRIRDLNPAPNVCDWVSVEVTLCDDDAPLVVTPLQYQPLSGGWASAVGVNTVPVTSDLNFILDEPSAFVAAQPAVTPNQIALRDYENNLLVDATITLSVGTNGRTTITISPDEPLMDEHRYYVTYDRYAIEDDNELCGGPNYLAERIDKSWWFKTMDNTPPVVVCGDILPRGDCVEKLHDIIVTVSDGNSVVVNENLSPAFIDIYEVGSSIPHERIPLSRHTKEFVEVVDGDSVWTFTFQTHYEYLSSACYTAEMPKDLFIDSFGNKSVYYCEYAGNGQGEVDGMTECEICEISWCAEDYEAPVAEWIARMDYSYLYVAYTDDQYVTDWEDGIAGDVITDVPTSSHFYVTFNEAAQVYDPVAETWRDLSYAIYNPAVLANALTITNEGDTLVYGPDYWLQYIPFTGNRAFRIIIANDYSHLGYGNLGSQPYLLGSMKSNSEYNIILNEGMISDFPSCDNPGNIIEEVQLLTIFTRDDTPPELTILDANGAVICDADCPETGFYINFNQPGFDVDDPNWMNWWTYWTPEWPANDMDDECTNICVAEGDHLRLEFNKPVVKTPAEILNRPFLWWENAGVDWWTEANLGLKAEDLEDPADSRFIKFHRWNGSAWVDAGVTFDVTITDNQFIDLAWDGDLVSEGIYAFTFAPYVVKDQIRVPDGNEFLGMTCMFQVVDHEEPLVAEFLYNTDSECDRSFDGPGYPMDVATDTQLGIRFNEPVKPGEAGKKLIIRRENGQQQQIIDATEITIDEDDHTIVWINNAEFEEHTLYYVEIHEGFVLDTAVCGSNMYAGIDPEDSAPGWQANIPLFEWVFATGDNTPPQPDASLMGAEFFPQIGADDVAKNSDLYIIFDENVQTDCLPYDPACDPFELTVSDYFATKGFYIYANTGENPDVDFGNFVEFIPFWVDIDGDYVQNPRVTISGTDIYNGLVSNKVTVDPVTVFDRNLTYYIRVSGNLFCDGFSNKWAGIRDNSWWFTITNDVAPEIEWAEPALFVHDGAPETLPAEPNGYVVTDLVMSFVDEIDKLPLNVAKGSGVVRIYEYIYNPATFSYYEKLYKEIDINNDSVVIEGNLVTIQGVTLRDDINPDNECLGPRMYYVTVTPGAITNGYPGSLTYWEGLNDAFDWRFYTAADDTFMVGHEIVKPLPGSENLSIEDASTLEITFAEDIEAWPVPEGTVKIFTVEGGVMVDEFTVGDDDITGNTLTLTTEALVDETEYYVTIDVAAFGDTSTCSTPFYGLLDTTEWTFGTGDNTPPVPVLVTELTECEDTCVLLTFEFDETYGVTAGEGMVNIWVDGEIFASTPAVVGEDVNFITAEFCGLPDTTVFFISLDEAAVYDNGNNTLPNAEIALAEWTFTTADNTPPVLAAIGPAGDDEESTVTLTVEASEVVVPVEGKKIVVSNGGPAMLFDVTDMETEDGMTFTLVVEDLEDVTTYDVTFEAGAFEDLSCDPNATQDETTWSFTTDDNTAPEVVETTPEDEEVIESYIGLVIDFTFDEEVAKGDGDITITRGEDVTVVPVDSSVVVVEGELVTLNLEDVLYFGDVTVSVPEGAFVDLAINPNDNVAYEWTFTIEDTTPPNCLTIIEPVDGAQGVLSDVYLTMEFCERMAVGNPARTLKVYEILEVQGGLDENDLFYETAIEEHMIDGEQVVVLVTGLADNTSYTVMIAEDAMRDEAGNAFEGIANPTTWNFTTGDNTPPSVTLIPAGSENDLNDIPVQAVFTEVVVGAIEEITVENAISYVVEATDDPLVYNIIIEAADLDTVIVTVPVTITDVPDAKGYGNPLAEEVTGVYVVGDNTPPTVEVTDGPEDPMDTEHTFTVELTFSEEVTGVADGISVTGGTMELSTVVEGLVYEVTLSGESKAEIVLSLSDVIEDLAGNPLEPVSFTYIVADTTPPTLVVDPESGTFITNEFEITLTFDEEVTGVADAVTVSAGTVEVTGDGMEYTAVVTAPSLSDVVLTVGTGVTDLAGNAFAGASYTYSVTGLVAIADVQGEANQSPIVGTVLQVEGTVTGVKPGEGFFMQDDNAAWSGIWVEYPDAADLEIGDGVAVVGEVGEPASVTTINASEVTMIDAPIAVVPVVVDSPSAAKNEMYESVLVQVEGARATAANDIGRWTIYYESMDNVDVGTFLFTYSPEEGHFYHVTGIVNGRLDDYRLEARMESDIVDITITDIDPVQSVEFKVYPNPFNNYIKIDNHDKLNRVVVTNIAGQRVIDIEYPSHEIRTANLVSGVYVVSMFTEDGLAKTERIVKR